MSNIEKTVEAVVVEIQKIDLKPGQFFAIIAPEDWDSRVINCVANYFREFMAQNKLKFPVVIFPHGTEFAVVTPPAGFSEDEL